MILGAKAAILGSIWGFFAPPGAPRWLRPLPTPPPSWPCPGPAHSGAIPGACPEGVSGRGDVREAPGADWAAALSIRRVRRPGRSAAEPSHAPRMFRLDETPEDPGSPPPSPWGGSPVPSQPGTPSPESRPRLCSELGPVSGGPGDPPPPRGRSRSAPPVLWAAQRYGRRLRRMSDEFQLQGHWGTGTARG
ncbi:bcl2-associated agonist of cell death isoform X2 [Chamaea fasciata]|uniref:bcl2-associated agonist of cell death isoform X2 n=1 Tax=Chamaea fasciata TaxID=190680 RepID=UPI00336A1D9E